MKIIKPLALKKGDTLGVITPSTPGYQLNKGLFESGVKNIEKLGFQIKLGHLTKKRSSQGYRSGTPKERASEFMELIEDDSVAGIICTIGGNNSASMIPYLDFKVIRTQRKVLSGYSDITSLHLAILKYSALSTFYGPCLMTWMGEYPDGSIETNASFLKAVTEKIPYPQKVEPPKQWSNHIRSWKNNDWKEKPRQYQPNKGWKALCLGSAKGLLVLANLGTLMSSAGTSYFPDVEGKILLIESMNAPFQSEERYFRQLQLMGVFDKISGLIIGKPEVLDDQGAPFKHRDLIFEIVGKRNYPVVLEFDCGHTVPMITFAQHSKITLIAKSKDDIQLSILESMVE